MILRLMVLVVIGSAPLAFSATQKVHIGEVKARGLWTPGVDRKAAVLMLPGSGAQGPEERMPASLSGDGQEHSLFNEFAAPLIGAGLHVLQLGKPGVEFFSTWQNPFYDSGLFASLRWKDLIANARAGLRFLREQPGIDPQRIYLLGHSEGTQLAVDAAVGENVKGLILLGYSGEDLLTTVSWQLFEREIDFFAKTDIDADHDGYITRDEAAVWPQFGWPWKPGQTSVSIADVAAFIRADPARQTFVKDFASSPYCSDGHCAAGSYYEKTVKFAGPLYVFTGELDLQTRAAEALKLKHTCDRVGKRDCRVKIVPGVQHGFNRPKEPRRHPLLDIALAPVEASFLSRLSWLANEL